MDWQQQGAGYFPYNLNPPAYPHPRYDIGGGNTGYVGFGDDGDDGDDDGDLYEPEEPVTPPIQKMAPTTRTPAVDGPVRLHPDPTKN
jgi:hypothetical protein